MYMNFAAATEVAEKAFHVGDAGVDWFYSTALLSAVPSFILAMTFSKTYHWAMSLAGVASTVAAAWLRYLATVQRSSALAIMSSVALGPGTGMIFTGFAQLPVMLFPPGSSRKVCTGIAVQTTFFGWAMGGLVAALLVKSPYDLSSFCFFQALIVSISLPVFLFCYGLPRHLLLGAEVPPYGTAGDTWRLGSCETYGTAGDTQMDVELDPGQLHTPPLGVQESAKSMLRNWRFLLQALSCALLQAVAFTVPAVLDEVFTSKGYGPIECAVTGFAFIMAGVVLGMVLAGPLAPSSGIESKSAVNRLVLALFWSASLAMLMLQLSVGQFSSHYAHMDSSRERAINFVLVVIGGACALGFVNVTLPLVCAEAHPVSETYAGGITELLGFGLAAVVTQMSAGLQFTICFWISLAAALLMTAGMCFSPALRDPAEQSVGAHT